MCYDYITGNERNEGCVFEGCMCEGCMCEGCMFEGCMFEGWMFDGCVFDGCIHVLLNGLGFVCFLGAAGETGGVAAGSSILRFTSDAIHA
jgi:hypothetical protein